MPSARPYATLLAKGEDRKQRILDVAQRLVTRNGWRNTTLAQIAREAGVSAAGLLHHFESKEQLLHAVVDARDADDAAHADWTGDLLQQLARAGDRVERAPELVGTYSVLLVENLMPDAPLHDRLLDRQRAAVRIITEISRPMVIRGHEVRIGASIGVATYPEDGSDEDKLTFNADIALFQAKKDGRNTYRFHSDD